MSCSNSRSLALLLALVAVCSVGCGIGPDAFSGTWSQNGTFTVSVDGRSQTEPLTGTIQVLEGAAGGIVFPMGGGCTVPFELGGNAATLKSGSTCTLPLQGGGSVLVTFSSGNAVLASSLSVMTVTLSGIESFTLADGASATAFFTQTATLNKLTK